MRKVLFFTQKQLKALEKASRRLHALKEFSRAAIVMSMKPFDEPVRRKRDASSTER
jgi:hypothetical protein